MSLQLTLRMKLAIAWFCWRTVRRNVLTFNDQWEGADIEICALIRIRREEVVLPGHTK